MDKVLLIADDNKDIVDILKIYAQKEGYKTVCAYDGEQALKMQKEYNPVLILLDVMMPKINGYDVCRQIRQTSNVPIIMVTAKSEEADRILGLDIGADDYVVKPFSPREVMTRIKAVLRRVSDEANDERNKRIEVAGLTIDMNSYEAYVNGKPVVLTKKEIEILWLFATNPGKVYTRDHLLENIWGYEYFGDTRTVDTHIKRIRTKLNLDETVGFDIKTVWGVGYKFEVKQ
ncbi:MAG: response regulator transcription factor [Eubacteriales bacterium]|jgi:two-component system response regulator ResD|nr:response regulator transcription factor [Clostridiales bacterium]MDD6340984.1 response regulator transcription factor [Eubacteriales bacterium]MDD7392898.1 response regulator transcription factor [Eubacteriales bacterium]MDY3760680.1 response regulator transcription factor [Eubacteriales bacterium]